jgi:hypothetical protein
MNDLLRWTFETLKNEGLAMNWLAQRREEWAPLLASRLRYLMEGATFILICDDEREWFEKYFLSNINRKNRARPMLPFVPLRALYPRPETLESEEDLRLLSDMLGIAFPNGYIFFYVGKTSAKLAKIAKSSELSYMWLFDERDRQNGFFLSSEDELLDVKLLQLFRIFDKSIDAALFGEVSL